MDTTHGETQIKDGFKAYFDRDYSAAFKLLQPLAQNGHAEAQFYLGNMYAHGNGLEEDLPEAIHWYQKAADQGSVSAQIALEDLYSKGEEFSKWVNNERRRRKKVNRRRCLIDGSFGFLAFVVVNGSAVFYGALVVGKFGLGRNIGMWLTILVWISLAMLFGGLAEKTSFLIESLIESWATWDICDSEHRNSFKNFPIFKRKALILTFNNDLDKITEKLDKLYIAFACELQDEKLIDDVEKIQNIINRIGRGNVSWKGFVLGLEGAFNELELELKNMSEYHLELQPLIKLAHSILSHTMNKIVAQ